MSSKLDQPLDKMILDRRQSARRPRTRRAAGAAGKAPTPATAPIGGVRKITKATKPTTKATPAGASSGPRESKIIVSNLPIDVRESQIKEYFSKTIGPVKKVILNYGANGQSRGVSTIIFSKPESAAEAVKALDGVNADDRPMKVEVVLGAKDAPEPPPAKTLKDRIAQPKPAAKPQPKPATATKATAGKGTRGKNRARGRNTGRGKPKTKDELDAEMQDYFGVDTGAPAGEGDAAMTSNGGAVQPAAVGGDTGMEDEIL